MSTQAPLQDMDLSELKAAYGQKPASLEVVDAHQFLTLDFPPREALLAPWLLTQSLCMIHSWRGVGKTHVSLGVAYAVASGGRFLTWEAPEPRKVLFVDGEMPGAALQERLAAIIQTAEREAAHGALRIITPDRQQNGMPDLATLEGQEAIDAALEDDTALIVLDNLSALCRSGGRENEAESWLSVATWALQKRAEGRAVLLIHHSGKSGAQRGTSKREDLLDIVLNLKRPADYLPSDGAIFEVHYEKARHLHGEETNPFEACLLADDHGHQLWVTKPLEESTFEKVVSLANEGLTQKEIADELGLHKSNVSRHHRKAEGLGLINKGGST